MKLIVRSLFIICALILLTIAQSRADNLNAVAGSGSNTTNSATYVTVATTGNIDVTNIDKVLVISTFEVERTQAASPRTVYWRIADNSGTPNTSNEIQRYLAGTGVTDYGIGSLVYIFDVGAITGTVNYSMQHRTTATQNVTTRGTITAIALTTTSQITLDNDMKYLSSGVNTTSSTYEGISGLTTDGILLPVSGGLLVAATINSQKIAGSGGSDAGQWKLQMRKGYTGSWTDIGNAISRSMSNTDDAGIITLYALLTDQSRDHYFFRVAHRVSNGTGVTVQTMANTTIAVVSLGYEASSVGQNFSGYVQTVASANTSSTTASNVATVSMTPAGTTALVISQFGMSATGTAIPIYSLSGSGSITSQEERRTLKDNTDQGAGGIVGLYSGLSGSSSFNLQHRLSSSGQTVTTSNVILGVINLSNSTASGYWTGSSSTSWGTAGNWADNTVPTSSTNVTIFDKSNDPVIENTANCNNINVLAGSGLTVNTGQTINISGDLIVESGGSFIDNGTVNLTGTAISKRYVTKDIWHYIGSPVSGQAINNTFMTENDVYSPNGGTNYNFYRWDEPANIWYIYGDAGFGDANFVSGRGYAITFASDRTIELKGSEVSGNVTQTVYKTNGSGREGFNLLANPYLSPIDLATFTNSTNNPNIAGTVYFWSEQSGWTYPQDNYAYWNGSGSIGNGTQVPSDQVGVNQGFMVEATSDNVNVNFTNAMRTHANPNFFKNEDEITRIKLAVQYSDENYNEMLISFLEGATNGFDRDFDARKVMPDANLLIYTPIIEGDEMLAIQGLPDDFEESLMIPVFIKNDVTGLFDLSVPLMEYFPENVDISLEDTETGIFTPMTPGATYSFEIEETGIWENRLILHFNNTTGIEDETDEETSNVNIYSYSKDIYVVSEDDNIKSIDVLDLSGRTIYKSQGDFVTLHKISLDVENGIYFVRVNTGNRLYTQKVFIN